MLNCNSVDIDANRADVKLSALEPERVWQAPARKVVMNELEITYLLREMTLNVGQLFPYDLEVEAARVIIIGNPASGNK